ncbi:MMPL family transporter [Streptomyces yaizuensis]|uniref:MMPL family transporter n=1 Tax=Streptomyces yaizuensis TaxID=2989713 RepID=A0ABQ5NZU4_9ACTN|nr:MMPL family transporter [Streptomyces sp. YSPA8]GLF95882.1 MMPL family transporter [Streptomyces sp. YSPA8]
MVRRLTSFAIRRRWVTILVWVLIGGALSVVGPSMTHRVTESRTGEFLPGSYGSAAALEIAESEFGVTPDGNAATLLVARTDGGRLTPQDREAVATAAADLGKRRITPPKSEEPFMKDYAQTPRVTPGPLAPDGTFQLLTVSLTGNPNDPGLQEVHRELRTATKEEFREHGLRAGFTGGIADRVDAMDAGETRQKVIGALTVLLIVLLNVLVFRSVLAALLPLIAVAIVGGAAAGAVAGTALLLDIRLDPSTPSLTHVVLLGIGIDYFLFLLFRFREQLRAHPDQSAAEAAAVASGRVGNAIASAGLTIVAAFATLGVASFGQFRVLGPAIAVSVLVMLLGSLTLMPALLAVTGRGMFWPARAWKREPAAGRAARLGEAVTRRPVRYVLLSLALLGVLSAGALGMRMTYDPSGGDRTEAVKVAEEISRSLPAGATDRHTLYVRSESGATLDRAALADLAGAVGRTEGVGQVGRPEMNEDGNAARIDVALTVRSDTQRARDLISGPVRTTIGEHTPRGTEAHITGTAAVFADVATAVEKDLRVVFPVAAALIALILLVLLRSLVAPLVLLLSVGLGFAATLGASTFLFQHTLERPGVMFTLPLVLFLFVVALGTDYNILISDRIKEEMERPVSTRRAVADAIRHTAPAITTAGLVLAGSFASLAADPMTQDVGFATALGITLSALVLSLVLVPALAVLCGRAFWWPRRPAARVPVAPAASGERVPVGSAPAPATTRYEPTAYEPTAYEPTTYQRPAYEPPAAPSPYER